MAARRRLPLVAVEATTLLSGVANGITTVALPWLVLEETGSAAGAGVVAAAAAVPLVVASFLAGALVDRVGRRVSAVGADVLSALAAAIPVVALVGDLSITTIAVLAALGAVFDPAGFTAREAMLPAAARAAGVRLERVNGLHEAVWGASFVVGPGVGGVLIGLVGAGSTLWATAAAFVLAAIVMAAVRIPGGGRPDRPAGARPGVLGDVREGLVFVWRDRMILSVALFTTLLAGTYLPIEGVLLPVHFEALDAPSRLGGVLLVMSLGWVAGSLLYGAVGHRLPRRATFLLSALGTALALVPMAFLPPYGVILASGALTGLLYGPLNPIMNLVMQVRTPERLRGRVIGVVTSIGYAAGPVGYLAAGPLVDAAGLRPAFLVVVGAVVVAGASALFLRSLRGLDALDPAGVGPAGAPAGRARGMEAAVRPAPVSPAASLPCPPASSDADEEQALRR
ncbi:MAG: MFS transporter [Kineosporiaceae bacterium]